MEEDDLLQQALAMSMEVRFDQHVPQHVPEQHCSSGHRECPLRPSADMSLP